MTNDLKLNEKKTGASKEAPVNLELNNFS